MIQHSVFSCVPKKIKNVCLHKNKYMNVKSSIIHKNPKWKQQSVHQLWIITTWYIHT